MREGAPNATLEFLAASPRSFMGVNTYTDVQTQGRNIRHYSDYLLQRVKAYSKTNCDYVRDGEGRVRRLTVDKGLLRETETVQEQIRACIKCDVGFRFCCFGYQKTDEGDSYLRRILTMRFA